MPAYLSGDWTDIHQSGEFSQQNIVGQGEVELRSTVAMLTNHTTTWIWHNTQYIIRWAFQPNLLLVLCSRSRFDAQILEVPLEPLPHSSLIVSYAAASLAHQMTLNR